MDHSARRHHLDLHRLSQISEQVPRRDDLRAVPQVVLEPYLAVVNGKLCHSERNEESQPRKVKPPSSSMPVTPFVPS